MPTNPTPIKPGARLLYCNRTECEPVTVTRVGRRWVYFVPESPGPASDRKTFPNGWPESKFDRATHAVAYCGFGTVRSGEVYASRAEWAAVKAGREAHILNGRAWDEFRKAVPYIRPAHLDAALCRLLTAIVTGDPALIAQTRTILAPGSEGGGQQ